MRILAACLLPALLAASAGCDGQHYEYVVRYQEYARTSLDQDGQHLFLTARATFIDTEPIPERGRLNAINEPEMTGDDRYRYALAHPEIFGPIGSRLEYEEQFGDGTGMDAVAVAHGGASTIEIVMSGTRNASFRLSPWSAVLERGGQVWNAVDAGTACLAVGAQDSRRDDGAAFHGDGAPVRFHFPKLTEVAYAAESLTAWQIWCRPEPVAEPFTLTLTTEAASGEPSHVFVFRFDRVAEHQHPPNPLYWLYQAH